MAAIKIFVRCEDQDNDDAVLLHVGSDMTVSEVMHDALPLLYARGAEPPLSHMQLWLDGADGPLKNRSVFANLGIRREDATFVLREKRCTSSVPADRAASFAPAPQHPTGAETPRPREPSRPAASMSPSPRAQVSSPRYALAVEHRDGGAGISVATLCNGEGTHAVHTPRGRRSVNTAARATDSSMLAVGMPPVQPGTKRDDGLTLLTGNVHSPQDPPRFRRVHQASPPHMRTTRDDWWGHTGGYGYGSPDHLTVTEKGFPQKKATMPLHCSKADHLQTSTNEVRLAQGTAAPRAASLPLLAMHVDSPCGKRRIRIQDDQLDGTLQPDSGCDRIDGRRLAVPPKEPERHTGYGLGPGLRAKMTQSNIVLAEEDPVHYAPQLAHSRTFASSVGALMASGDALPSSPAPEEAAGGSAQRRGRASASLPRQASQEPLAGPVVTPATPYELRRMLLEKVALCGGHGSTGEMQYAWRQLCQGRGTLRADDFCDAVSREFRLSITRDDLEGMGHSGSRVSFKDFCSLCSTDGGDENRLPSEEARAAGIRCHGMAHESAQRSLRAPFGVGSDAVPPHRSMRRAF